jgi:hypothetical protein
VNSAPAVLVISALVAWQTVRIAAAESCSGVGALLVQS